jgi:hypothetical protein
LPVSTARRACMDGLDLIDYLEHQIPINNMVERR